MATTQYFFTSFIMVLFELTDQIYFLVKIKVLSQLVVTVVFSNFAPIYAGSFLSLNETPGLKPNFYGILVYVKQCLIALNIALTQALS